MKTEKRKSDVGEQPESARKTKGDEATAAKTMVEDLEEFLDSTGQLLLRGQGDRMLGQNLAKALLAGYLCWEGTKMLSRGTADQGAMRVPEGPVTKEDVDRADSKASPVIQSVLRVLEVPTDHTDVEKEMRAFLALNDILDGIMASLFSHQPKEFWRQWAAHIPRTGDTAIDLHYG